MAYVNLIRNAGLLTSATNPENGTVTYTYNADNTLQKKHQANGADIVYTYDSAKRVTAITGQSACGPVSFTYDTNPVNPDFAQYTYGRLTTAQYPACGLNQTPVTEMYSYHPAGAVTAKRLTMNKCDYDGDGNYVCGDGYLEADYTYTPAGQVLTYGTALTTDTYPLALTFTYGFDGMGRPVSLTDNFRLMNTSGYGNRVWATAQYDYAGRMSGLSTTVATETRTFNVNGQLGSQAFGSLGTINYGYSATQNSGQIAQMSTTVTGETVTYTYDALKRLTSATGNPIAGTTPPGWSQTFQYDGFGNLTGRTPNPSGAAMAVTGATNRLSSALYDNNGNMLSGGGLNVAYDGANRISFASQVSGGAAYYGYAPDNKRILRTSYGGQDEWTFYGAYGENLGTFHVYGGAPSNGLPTVFRPIGTNVWFLGKMINEGGVAPNYNQLGTRAAGRFYPYGEEIGTATPNDAVKFATYKRDSYTGLDYADQRYYASTLGRFTTADPYRASAGTEDPGSWNRYGYVVGDPINRFDKTGLDYNVPPGGSFNPRDPRNVGSGTSISVSGDGPMPYGAGGRGTPQPINLNRTIAEYDDEHDQSDDGAEDQASSQLDLIASCTWNSTLNHFGLSSATGASGLLSLPIPKGWVPPFREIGSETTNLLSVLGHFVDINIPRVVARGLGTTNLLRLAGRLNPYLTAALAITDVASISIDTYKCYNAQSEQPAKQ